MAETTTTAAPKAAPIIEAAGKIVTTAAPVNSNAPEYYRFAANTDEIQAEKRQAFLKALNTAETFDPTAFAAELAAQEADPKAATPLFDAFKGLQDLHDLLSVKLADLVAAKAGLQEFLAPLDKLVAPVREHGTKALSRIREALEAKKEAEGQAKEREAAGEGRKSYCGHWRACLFYRSRRRRCFQCPSWTKHRNP